MRKKATLVLILWIESLNVVGRLNECISIISFHGLCSPKLVWICSFAPMINDDRVDDGGDGSVGIVPYDVIFR